MANEERKHTRPYRYGGYFPQPYISRKGTIMTKLPHLLQMLIMMNYAIKGRIEKK